MNGAKRIRNACAVWYLLLVVLVIVGATMLSSRPTPPVIGEFWDSAAATSAAEVTCQEKQAIGFWILVSLPGATGLVFLIHLLAAIWETLIGMAPPREARTEPRPLPGPGPQA